MSLTLILKPEAEDDLVAAQRWYEEQREGLGVRFVTHVELALERIRRFPLAATEVEPTIRRVLVPKFPYGIFYLVERDQIVVIAVYHDRKDPAGWLKRISNND